jgi:curved DNA-binding protein CbpA
MKDPWATLGVPKGSDEKSIRKAFREKARKLHPDKGGSASDFRELYEAYEILRDTREENDGDDEWFGWLGRWAKRFIGTDDKILRMKVPYTLLQDRSQSIQLEYDGIPVSMDLTHTEKITFGGLRIRIIPHAYIQRTSEEEEQEMEQDPWLRDTEWLFMVPKDTHQFKLRGGEWSDTEGEYMDGVCWFRSKNE